MSLSQDSCGIGFVRIGLNCPLSRGLPNELGQPSNIKTVLYLQQDASHNVLDSATQSRRVQETLAELGKTLTGGCYSEPPEGRWLTQIIGEVGCVSQRVLGPSPALMQLDVTKLTRHGHVGSLLLEAGGQQQRREPDIGADP